MSFITSCSPFRTILDNWFQDLRGISPFLPQRLGQVEALSATCGYVTRVTSQATPVWKQPAIFINFLFFAASKVACFTVDRLS